MRLIDADKYPCRGCGETYCYKNCGEFNRWLDGCDYDLNKVMNTLKLHSTDQRMLPEWVLEVVREGGLE